MNNKSLVFMFSGQGSQSYHMGKELYLNNKEFKKSMDYMDEIVIKSLGRSIISELFNENQKKSDPFDTLFYTHPAIFMVEYALAKTLMAEGVNPDYLWGTSLGEFVAIALAEVVDLKTALEMVMKMAMVVEKNCTPGGMMAIVENTDILVRERDLFSDTEVVSINYDSHFVLAAKKEILDQLQIRLKPKRVIYQSLPVRYAFHSQWIEGAKADYVSYLKTIKFDTPKIPILSSITGEVVNQFSYEYFWNVVRQPMNFRGALKSLDPKKVVYIDAGPSGTMANFVKNNYHRDVELKIFSIMTPFNNDLANLSKIINKFKTNKTKRVGDTMIAYVFPGQGSQQKGMGGQLFDEFEEITRIADQVLGYSIKDLCINNSENLLGLTQYTQPALYVVNALHYLKKIKEEGRKPDYVAGHSLGEYNALYAAGIFDFETGLRIVQKRGELMSKAKNGGMAASIGLKEEAIRQVIQENKLDSIDVANLNTPTQIVLSGLYDDIMNAKSTFEAAGARYIPLAVSGAFHSRYMVEAKNEFEKFIRQFNFNKPEIAVISNVQARPYRVSELIETMVQQIVSPVKWCESIRYLMGKGVEEILQVGPGNVLTGMVVNIKRDAEPLFVEDEVEEEVVEKVVVMEAPQPVIETTKESVSIEEVAATNITLEKKTQTIGERLGCKEFKKDYNLKYAYTSGGMYKGVASKEMVVRMGKAGMIGFFGSGGLDLNTLEENIQYIQSHLKNGEAYGMNMIHIANDPEKEDQIIDLYMKYNVKVIEAAAYMSISPSLVRYRLKGLRRSPNGDIIGENKIIAKISRPEVAQLFLSPAPERIVNKLLEERKITQEEAELSKRISMADDLCVEADSGGHTDHGVAYALMPAMIKLRDEMVNRYGYNKKIRVGSAGGIGTPEAAAAAFILGADFIVTGSINQCTVEGATSDVVKDMLQDINIHNTTYAPAGDMFEMGAKVQVLKKGLFFPARANKLYSLYTQYNSIDEIDEDTKKKIQEKYFNKSFEAVYEDVKQYYPANEIEKAERNPKHKMALIFKWYFGYSTRLALGGNKDHKVDYQVHCGPALGAFNQWVKGTHLEDWRNRHVDEIGVKMMDSTAELLENRLQQILL